MLARLHRHPRNDRLVATGSVLLLMLLAVLAGGCDASATKATEAFNRGLDAANKHQHDEAVLAYDEAIRLKPDDAIAYYNRGLSQYDLHKVDEAIRDYTECIKLKPDFAQAYVDRGEAYISKNENIKAQADFDKAKSLDPSVVVDSIAPQVLRAEADKSKSKAESKKSGP